MNPNLAASEPQEPRLPNCKPSDIEPMSAPLQLIENPNTLNQNETQICMALSCVQLFHALGAIEETFMDELQKQLNEGNACQDVIVSHVRSASAIVITAA